MPSQRRRGGIGIDGALNQGENDAIRFVAGMIVVPQVMNGRNDDGGIQKDNDTEEKPGNQGSPGKAS